MRRVGYEVEVVPQEKFAQMNGKNRRKKSFTIGCKGRLEVEKSERKKNGPKRV